MDPSTPLAVGKGAIITSATTGVLVGAYGLVKGSRQIGPLIISASVNGGIAGATFFSFREYIVSPTLLYALSSTYYSRRIREIQATREEGGHSGGRLTWWDMRMYKVPDTAISGALTGGVLNAWKRGRPGIIPGITTAGLVCTFLQLAYNELGIARIKYVSKKMQESSSVTPPEPSTFPSTPPFDKNTDLEPPRPVIDRILTYLGFHKLSGDEYLDMMKRKRDGYLRRIAELEEEKKLEEQSSKSSTSSAET
ncbi:hypothetical protein AcW1_006170 [Taiwanofungus camphoratus]|nr:hypothetical protein AcW1_006170 [Antrodia cinnamomea]